MSHPGVHNWWGAVWVEKMERLAERTRFATGEEYARTGRVLFATLEGRTVVARVQEPGESPCTVRITIDPFTPEQWTSLFAEVRDHARLATEVVSGNLPLDLQTAFSRAQLKFMPERYADLHLECGCSDWLKPCRHLVAAWLKFAHAFDHDPFLVFELRGLHRDDLLARLGDRRPAAVLQAEEEAYQETTVPVRPEPLPADPALFWAAPALPPARTGASERLLFDDDIFERLRDWPDLEPQFHQLYDSVYELATKLTNNPGK